MLLTDLAGAERGVAGLWYGPHMPIFEGPHVMTCERVGMLQVSHFMRVAMLPVDEFERAPKY